MAHAVEQKVEWAYAFDVHCNSFFPVFLILYVLQFFFMPLLQRSNWISILVGNTMYLCATVWYIYGTFLGYNGKPKARALVNRSTHFFLVKPFHFWCTRNSFCIQSLYALCSTLLHCLDSTSVNMCLRCTSVKPTMLCVNRKQHNVVRGNSTAI